MDEMYNTNESYSGGGYEYQTPAVDPGKGLGIASLVVALVSVLCCGGNIGCIVALILGFMARSKSKAAGFSNGMATAGIIISAIFLVLSIILGIVLAIFYIAMFAMSM